MSDTCPGARRSAGEALYHVAGGVATITLNRPERLNTISGPMLSLLSRLRLGRRRPGGALRDPDRDGQGVLRGP